LIPGGHCPVRASANIPEAIQHPWELSLSGSWSDLYGAHLTFTASEDIPANGHGGPANPHGTDGASPDRGALRRHFRAARAAFVTGLRAKEAFDVAGLRASDALDVAGSRLMLENALADRLLPLLPPGRVIGAYHAGEYELDPGALMQRLTARGQRIGFPWFADRDTPMLFRDGPDRAVGPYGVDQPSAQAPAIVPDVLLMPLVAVDLSGNRLGQGGGHYDRALHALRRQQREVLAIGLAWDVQIADSLPAEPWDEPLDLIATPSRLIEIRK
jgi:5-formyltetrahydrofolate cyclo-ligase